jgi:hypothetical protein
MMDGVRVSDRLKNVINKAFKAKGSVKDKIELMNPNSEEKVISQEIEFIENCTSKSVLPLPLTK